MGAEEEAKAERHPRAALLVVEVADSSARRDVGVKAAVYAGAGIPEFWLVLLQQRAIEVRRDPDAAAGKYLTLATHSGAATVTPAAFAGPTIPVAALFD